MQNLRIPESADAKSLRRQPSVALHIAGAFGMLGAIGFDDQARRHTDEIGYIVANGRLPAEFMAGESPVTQNMPERFFSLGRLLAHGSRMSDQFPATSVAFPLKEAVVGGLFLLPLREKVARRAG